MKDIMSPRGVCTPDLVGLQLVAISHGDLVAFAQLYESTAAPVYGLAVRILRDEHQAEEVVQEVYLHLWRTCGVFDPERGSGRAWVLLLAHRRAVDRVRSVEASRRRDAAHVHRTHEITFDQTSTSALDSIEAQSVRAALRLLSSVQRQALELAYFDGLSYRDVADTLQIPHGTAKTRIRDGMIRLRDSLMSLN